MSDGTRPGTGTSTTSRRAPVEQLPDPFVAVQRGEVGERAARERERMAAAVLVHAGRKRGVAASGEQGCDGLRGNAGLVREQQHEHLGLRVDCGERGGDRRRASLPELAVLDDVDAVQVDGPANRVRAAAQDADELVELAGASGGERVVEQRPVAVRQQLLRLAEAQRAAGGQHEARDLVLRHRLILAVSLRRVQRREPGGYDRPVATDDVQSAFAQAAAGRRHRAREPDVRLAVRAGPRRARARREGPARSGARRAGDRGGRAARRDLRAPQGRRLGAARRAREPAAAGRPRARADRER